MRIVIITMDDPVQTIPFMQQIIDARKDDIVALVTAKGDRLRIGKKRSKFVYVLSLLLIMGVPYFIENTITTLWFKFRMKLSKYLGLSSPSIRSYAAKKGIPIYDVKGLRSSAFLNELRGLKPDVIIHQSQNIVRKELLEIPTIGVLNRHNALLPKNRGRLTPFWVLYKGETETGVSIHFVDEGIDSGEIVVQRRFAIEKSDTFRSVVNKNYALAANAMLEALDKLEQGERSFIVNNDDEATYNTVPSFRDAWNFRMRRWL